jgi:hypothetical protein
MEEHSHSGGQGFAALKALFSSREVGRHGNKHFCSSSFRKIRFQSFWKWKHPILIEVEEFAVHIVSIGL